MPKRTHEAAMRTKQIILDAAFSLFSEKGYDKTSLSDVARRAGVTRGAIYWHFEDKGELLCALCKELADKYNLVNNLERAANPEEEDPLGQLKRWVLLHTSAEAAIFFSSEFAKILRSIFYTNNESLDSLRERVMELIYERNQLLSAAIRNAINHKQLPADLDIELACYCIADLLVGFCNRGNLSYEVASPEVLFTRLINALFANLHQLRRDSFR
ncbi:MAG: TetR family transcriptional regulator [Candidatus Anaerobiospirillum merdipullorum]|uniref:TetR family transcriptional regulator n=1 Tax=Candidatus Anaerobiospirillum merdipullorum TaxID=2838450 RepID=A0A9E2KNW5_9GAMM|nr:TetR family transcriptional regulator [Candidatus Anaerobiospirillum merdipullorum]